MVGALIVRRDIPVGAPRRGATLHHCEICGKRPAQGLLVDRRYARACRRCADAIYGLKD